MNVVVDKLRQTILRLGVEGRLTSSNSDTWPSNSLEEVCSIRRGSTITRKESVPGEVPVVAGGITPAYYHNVSNIDGPVITVSGSGANAGFVNFFQQPIWASDCSVIKVQESGTANIKFIYYCLQAQQDDIYSLKKGAAIPHVYANDLKHIEVILPPLQTQRRIVVKIEKLMKMCDLLEDRLDNLANVINNLEQTILQLAVQGKLVPQDSSDEPASHLISAIEKEKHRLTESKQIKKSRPLPPITDEEKLFDVPDSWEWVRLGEITEINIGKTPSRSLDSHWCNGIYNWVTIADMKPFGVIADKTKELVSEEAFHERFNSEIVSRETLLLSFKLTIGRTSILGMPAFHNEGIVSLPFYLEKEILTHFYLWILPILVKTNRNRTNAVKGQTLNKSKLKILVIPIPPPAEQKRIVAKIEELMQICDFLDKQMA